MIICSCRAVAGRTVDAAISAGARSIPELADMCGAGGRCGGCWPELERRLETHVSIRVGSSADRLRSVA